MQNQNPGHTIGGGYPFEKNESKALFTTEKRIEIETGTGHAFSDLLITAYKEMLEIAENQIEDILHEDPFVPETFGFELAHRSSGIHEPPVRIYLSRFNDKYTLFRKPGTPGDTDWNPMAWVLKQKLDDGSFKDIELNLCSHRIAYAAFYALGVQVKQAEKGWMQEEMDKAAAFMKENVKRIEEMEISAMKHATDKDTFKTMGGIFPLMAEESGYVILNSHEDGYEVPNKKFFIKFKRNDDRGSVHIEKDVYLDADNEIEAVLAAKDILELYDSTYQSNIHPSELSPFITRQYTHRRRSAIEPIGKMKRIHVDSDRGFVPEEIKYAKEWFLSRKPFKESTHMVMWFRANDKEINGEFVNIDASSDSEALTKAKFILETDADNLIENILFEELSVI